MRRRPGHLRGVRRVQMCSVVSVHVLGRLLSQSYCARVERRRGEKGAVPCCADKPRVSRPRLAQLDAFQGHRRALNNINRAWHPFATNIEGLTYTGAAWEEGAEDEHAQRRPFVLFRFDGDENAVTERLA